VNLSAGTSLRKSPGGLMQTQIFQLQHSEKGRVRWEHAAAGRGQAVHWEDLNQPPTLRGQQPP
jgi:hypothetical protein